MSIAKARTLLAKFNAITNASEFIRSHGEEGFSFEDKKFDDVYQRETKKLSAKLEKQAVKIWNEYEKLGIEIDDSIDENY
jgi:hypothetical protein